MKFLKENRDRVERYKRWQQKQQGLPSKEEVAVETRAFFQSIIDEKGTYALSDYVEELYEDDIEKQAEMVAKRDELKRKCEVVGLDIHVISQQVAEDNFHFAENGEVTPRAREISNIDDIIDFIQSHSDEIRAQLEGGADGWNQKISALARIQARENVVFSFPDDEDEYEREHQMYTDAINAI